MAETPQILPEKMNSVQDSVHSFSPWFYGGQLFIRSRHKTELIFIQWSS